MKLSEAIKKARKICLARARTYGPDKADVLIISQCGDIVNAVSRSRHDKADPYEAREFDIVATVKASVYPGRINVEIEFEKIEINLYF
jgi:hypothetical protein